MWAKRPGISYSSRMCTMAACIDGDEFGAGAISHDCVPFTPYCILELPLERAAEFIARHHRRQGDIARAQFADDAHFLARRKIRMRHRALQIPLSSRSHTNTACVAAQKKRRPMRDVAAMRCSNFRMAMRGGFRKFPRARATYHPPAVRGGISRCCPALAASSAAAAAWKFRGRCRSNPRCRAFHWPR